MTPFVCLFSLLMLLFPFLVTPAPSPLVDEIRAAAA